MHKFTDQAGGWIGWADRILEEPGGRSTWHYHNSSDTFVYVMSGSITVSFGLGSEDIISASAGTFLTIPSGTIHRETIGEQSRFEAFVIRIGGLPETIEVDGPHVQK